MKNKHLILYDGSCGFCNRRIQFVLKRDRANQFLFSPLQSDLSKSILEKYKHDPMDLNTLYVISNFQESDESVLSKSKASLFILRKLGGIGSLAQILHLLPTSLLNYGYDLIAANRHRIGGRKPCPLPSKEDRKKFLSTLLF